MNYCFIILYIFFFQKMAEEEMDVEGAGDDSMYSHLSNFTIDKKIGKGQFSEVYRARCRHNNATVALKKVQVCKGLKRICWLRRNDLKWHSTPLLSTGLKMAPWIADIRGCKKSEVVKFGFRGSQ